MKGYATHERGTLEAVVKARNAAIAAQGPAAQAPAENVLTGALRQLFALSEAYPDLKANANFQQLQTELSDIENKIAAARRFFNNAVQEYNTGIQQLPAPCCSPARSASPSATFFDLGEARAAARTGAAGQVLTRKCLRPWRRGKPQRGLSEAWRPTGSTPTSSRTGAARSRC